MKKGSRQLVMLGISAVILSGAYMGLTAWNSYSADKKAQKEQEEEEAAKIYLCEIEDFKQLEIVNENGTFAFSYDEEEEKWNYDKDEHFPVLQSKITSIVTRTDGLLAVRKLEGAEEDLSVYGLAEPLYTLTITGDESTVVTLYFGDESEANGNYYVGYNDCVYTISSDFSTVLGITEDTVLQTETFPEITSSEVIKLTWESENEEIVVRQDTREVEPEVETEAETEGELETEAETETEAELETELETEGEPETESYWLCEEDEIEDTTQLEELLTLMSELTYTNCADYYLETDEEKQYGLDKAYSVLEITSVSDEEEIVYTLKIGGLTEDESAYYVVMNDSTMVNTISAESVEQIREFFET